MLFRPPSTTTHAATRQLTYDHLVALFTHPTTPIIPRLRTPTTSTPAAVLIPFLHLHSTTPAILFTLRSSKLKSHTGEVSFPGGKLDPILDGNDLIQCAIRETMEEIGVGRDDIQIVSEPLNPVTSKDGRSRAYPVVGYVNLPSLSASSCILGGARVGSDESVLEVNPDEVDIAFYMTVEELLAVDDAPCRRRRVRFGGERGLFIHEWRVPERVEAILNANVAIHERKEMWIWGLTAYVLERILRWILTPEAIQARLDAAVIPLGPPRL